jgi:hypothetical protein
VVHLICAMLFLSLIAAGEMELIHGRMAAIIMLCAGLTSFLWPIFAQLITKAPMTDDDLKLEGAGMKVSIPQKLVRTEFVALVAYAIFAFLFWRHDVKTEERDVEQTEQLRVVVFMLSLPAQDREKLSKVIGVPRSLIDRMRAAQTNGSVGDH